MKLSATAKKMVLAICVSLALIIAAGAVYYRSPEALPFALGALLGGGLNVAKLVMLERCVDRAISMEKERAGNYIRIQHLIRLLLTGAVLIIAVFVPFLSLWGCAAGVLTMQVAAFAAKFAKDPMPTAEKNPDRDGK